MPQYRPLGVVPTPANWTIPDSVELDLELLFAHYDGAAAAGSYVPAVEIISDSGDTVGIMKMPSTVAAGSSVEATWGPFLGVNPPAAVSSPGLMWASVEISGNFAITDTVNGNIVPWHDAIYDTGTPTPFWSNANPTRLTAPANGYYLSVGNLEFEVITVSTNLGCYLYRNGATGLAFEYEFNSDTVLSSDGAGSASYTLQGGSHGVIALNQGDYLELLAFVQPTTGVPSPTHLIDLRPAQNHYAKWTLICLATTPGAVR